MRAALHLSLLAVLVVSSILDEAQRRSSPLDQLFAEQRAAVEDPSRRKCLWTTGRAGKSTTVLTAFVDDGLKHPYMVYFYFCLTMPHVEEIAWPTLRRLDRDFGLGCRFQEDKLRVILPSGSWIRLFGFDRPLALDRFYGIALRGAAADEAAFANIDLEEFVEDTIGPRLIDHQGTFWLMSIPGRVPRGLFDEIIRGFPRRENMRGVRSPSRPDWSVHSWTALENPTVRDLVLSEIAQKVAARAYPSTSPEALAAARADLERLAWFRRNYLGERVQERGDLVYPFDRDKNTYWRLDKDGQRISAWARRPDDHYVLGIDFGWDDATAFSLNAWRDDLPLFVELESYAQPEMMMSAIAARVRLYQEWIAPAPLTIVGDPARKNYFEELRRRYQLPIMVAEKANKLDWIEVFVNDLSAGLVQYVAPDDSPHVREMQGLTWKVMKDGKRLEQPGAANNGCDAQLMAYRHAYHYLHTEAEPKPEPGSRAAELRLEADLLAQVERDDEAAGDWLQE